MCSFISCFSVGNIDSVIIQGCYCWQTFRLEGFANEDSLRGRDGRRRSVSAWRRWTDSTRSRRKPATPPTPRPDEDVVVVEAAPDPALTLYNRQNRVESAGCEVGQVDSSSTAYCSSRQPISGLKSRPIGRRFFCAIHKRRGGGARGGSWLRKTNQETSSFCVASVSVTRNSQDRVIKKFLFFERVGPSWEKKLGSRSMQITAGWARR